MSRDLQNQILEAKNETAQRTLWLVDLHLKASGIYPSESFYVSSQTIEFGGNFYEPRLRGKPQIKNSLGAATDGGSIVVDNTDLIVGQTVLPKERFVEGSSVVIRKAWKIYNSIFADEVFSGELGSAELSTSDNTLKISLTGDLYKKNANLGAFPLAQRCVVDFNVGGILSPEESMCGWQIEQGGDPTRCGKTEDDCIAHNNLHRIRAIPFFANVSVQSFGGEPDFTGFGGGGSRGRDGGKYDPVFEDNLF